MTENVEDLKLAIQCLKPWWICCLAIMACAEILMPTKDEGWMQYLKIGMCVSLFLLAGCEPKHQWTIHKNTTVDGNLITRQIVVCEPDGGECWEVHRSYQDRESPANGVE